MEALRRPLTEKEWNWIRYYFYFRGNASKASREVYGGSPGACRVKGWRKKKKFTAVLGEIINRELYLLEGGIDIYLSTLNKKAEEHKAFMREVGGTRGLLRTFKRWK
jgi:hypothetical protein